MRHITADRESVSHAVNQYAIALRAVHSVGLAPNIADQISRDGVILDGTAIAVARHAVVHRRRGRRSITGVVQVADMRDLLRSAILRLIDEEATAEITVKTIMRDCAGRVLNRD